MFHYRTALAALALLCSSFASAQSGAPPALPVLSAADLQADVAILRRAYETLHPGLYRYNTPAEMDAHFAQLSASLNHNQSLQDAYLAFSLFAAQVKCGHTYANFFNQPESVADLLFKSQTRVPFYFDWIDQSMVVTTDFTPDHGLPRGTEVLAINGTATSTILARMMTIARADGSNDAKRVASLAITGDSLYETFDIFFPMLFPQHGTTLRLRIRKPGDARSQLISAEALTYQQRTAPIRQRENARKGGSDVLFEWHYLSDGSAYLRMPTWALFNSKWDWKSWLNQHLDELADSKAPGLIIDLRGNEGGLDVGNVILARLVHRDLALSQMRRLVRYRKVPDDLALYLDTWDPSFKDWGTAAVDLQKPWPTAPPVPYLLLKRYDDDVSGDRIQPAGNQYYGRVAVLVDSSNSSATFQFAQIIQQNKLGILIGEPTGGSQRGINGGAFFFLRLPKSHIEMDLPLIGTFPHSSMPDAGLTPDVRATRSRDDIAHDRDPALDAATRVITASPATVER